MSKCDEYCDRCTANESQTQITQNTLPNTGNKQNMYEKKRQHTYTYKTQQNKLINTDQNQN